MTTRERPDLDLDSLSPELRRSYEESLIGALAEARMQIQRMRGNPLWAVRRAARRAKRWRPAS